MNKRLMFSAVFAVLALSVLVFVSAYSDESDAAAVDRMWVTGSPVEETFVSGAMYMEVNNFSIPGLNYRIDFRGGIFGIGDSRSVVVYGTPVSVGVYHFEIRFWNQLTSGHHDVTITVVSSDPGGVMYTVTYNAAPGLVKNQSTWSESVPNGGHPSAPPATFSNGSLSFFAWSTSPSSYVPFTSSSVVSANTSVYARYEQNFVSFTEFPTGFNNVTQGQSYSYPIVTDPADSAIRIVEGPSWARIVNNVLVIDVPAGFAPGNVSVVLNAAASGWGTGVQKINFRVPVFIEEPIERRLVVGSTLYYQPVTNPSLADITLISAKFDGEPVSGFSVVNRTITGLLTTAKGVGVYTFEFRVSAPGFESSNKLFRLYADEALVTGTLPTISNIVISFNEYPSKVVDLIARGITNADSIVWTKNGQPFESGRDMVVAEPLDVGKHYYRCTVTNSVGSAYREVNMFIFASQYPQAAFVDVLYQYAFADTQVPDISGASWMTVGPAQDGYRIVSGTPTSAMLGNSYTISATGAGSPSPVTFTVYQSFSTAPTSSFEYVVGTDGRTVTTTFTGSNASVVYWRYGDGSAQTTSTTHTYTEAGWYTIECTAVNNITGRVVRLLVPVGGVDEEIPAIDPVHLTDVRLKQGEHLRIPLILLPGDVVNLTGTVTSWATYAAGVISGDTADAELGEYTLGVIVTHADSTQSVGNCKVIIVSADGDEEDGDYSLYVFSAVFLFILVCGVVLLGKSGGGRHG